MLNQTDQVSRWSSKFASAIDQIFKGFKLNFFKSTSIIFHSKVELTMLLTLDCLKYFNAIYPKSLKLQIFREFSQIFLSLVTSSITRSPRHQQTINNFIKLLIAHSLKTESNYKHRKAINVKSIKLGWENSDAVFPRRNSFLSTIATWDKFWTNDYFFWAKKEKIIVLNHFRCCLNWKSVVQKSGFTRIFCLFI